MWSTLSARRPSATLLESYVTQIQGDNREPASGRSTPTIRKKSIELTNRQRYVVFFTRWKENFDEARQESMNRLAEYTKFDPNVVAFLAGVGVSLATTPVPLVLRTCFFAWRARCADHLHNALSEFSENCESLAHRELSDAIRGVHKAMAASFSPIFRPQTRQKPGEFRSYMNVTHSFFNRVRDSPAFALMTSESNGMSPLTYAVDSSCSDLRTNHLGNRIHRPSTTPLVDTNSLRTHTARLDSYNVATSCHNVAGHAPITANQAGYYKHSRQLISPRKRTLVDRLPKGQHGIDFRARRWRTCDVDKDPPTEPNLLQPSLPPLLLPSRLLQRMMAAESALSRFRRDDSQGLRLLLLRTSDQDTAALRLPNKGNPPDHRGILSGPRRRHYDLDNVTDHQHLPNGSGRWFQNNSLEDSEPKPFVLPWSH